MIMKKPGELYKLENEKIMEYTSHAPPWLLNLLRTSFFMPCSLHAEVSNKSECNQYCLDCMGHAFCPSCLHHHKDHHIIQIRRSSYHDVVRVSEIQRVLDLNGIQSYIINSARVVFINGRPQLRQGKGVTNNCEICDRSLLDAFRFCSLGCKLAGIIRNHPEMTFILEQQSKLPWHGGIKEHVDSPRNKSSEVDEGHLHGKRPRPIVKVMRGGTASSLFNMPASAFLEEDVADESSSLSSELVSSTCHGGGDDQEYNMQYKSSVIRDWVDSYKYNMELNLHNFHKAKLSKLSPINTLHKYDINPLTNHNYALNDRTNISPPTPPPIHRRSPNRRKGVPHRAHMGV